MMREQTLISRFTSRFCFVELTFGRMPIFTRRSRVFLDTLRPRVIDGSEAVAAFGVGFCA